MGADLDALYLEWLYDQTKAVKTRPRRRTFWSLLGQLHSTQFVPLLHLDTNREADGRDLRDEFVSQCGINAAETPMAEYDECTMLELLIGLSRRLAFEVDAQADVWFWHMLDVLDLEQFNDMVYDDHAHMLTEEALNRVIWRRYSPNGSGGLFPLRNPQEDQREVELWYQLSAYLLEHF